MEGLHKLPAVLVDEPPKEILEKTNKQHTSAPEDRASQGGVPGLEGGVARHGAVAAVAPTLVAAGPACLGKQAVDADSENKNYS